MSKNSPLPTGASTSDTIATNTNTNAAINERDKGASAIWPVPTVVTRRVHICRFCGETYARLEDLQDHERSHTKQKPYKCEQCGLSFSAWRILRRHQRESCLMVLSRDGATIRQVPRPSVQRDNHLDTSNSYNEQSSTFSTESSFNFDHPDPTVTDTTGQPFHVPEIEDLLWQEDYIDDSTQNANSPLCHDPIYHVGQGSFAPMPEIPEDGQIPAIRQPIDDPKDRFDAGQGTGPGLLDIVDEMLRDNSYAFGSYPHPQNTEQQLMASMQVPQAQQQQQQMQQQQTLPSTYRAAVDYRFICVFCHALFEHLADLRTHLGNIHTRSITDNNGRDLELEDFHDICTIFDPMPGEPNRLRAFGRYTYKDVKVNRWEIKDWMQEKNEEGSGDLKEKGQRFFCTGFALCDLSFTRSEDLARHVRDHLVQSVLQHQRNRIFSPPEDIRQHVQTVHVEEEIPLDSLAARVESSCQADDLHSDTPCGENSRSLLANSAGSARKMLEEKQNNLQMEHAEAENETDGLQMQSIFMTQHRQDPRYYQHDLPLTSSSIQNSLMDYSNSYTPGDFNSSVYSRQYHWLGHSANSATQLSSGSYDGISGPTDVNRAKLRTVDPIEPTGQPIEAQSALESSISIPSGTALANADNFPWGSLSAVNLNNVPSMHYDSYSTDFAQDYDGISEYSDDSLTEMIQEDLVHDFSMQFAKDFGVCDSDAMFTEDMLHDLENSLLDSALRLWHETTTLEGRAAMKFIHQYRGDLAQSFYKPPILKDVAVNIHEDNIGYYSDIDRSEGEHKDLVGSSGQTLTMLEKMKLWDSKNIRNAATEFEDTMSTSEPDVIKPKTKIFQNYYAAISRTSSYQWLRSRIRNQLHLLGKDATVMRSIKETISRSLPRPKRVSRRSTPPVTHAIFEVQWPSRRSAQEPWYLPFNSDQLCQGLTLTGTFKAAQAMSCSAYLKQNWPMSGRTLLDLISKVLETGQEQVYRRDDGTQLIINRNSEHLIVSVQGSRGAAEETGLQLCWLSAVLESSSTEMGICQANPSLRRLYRRKTTFVESEGTHPLVKHAWQKPQGQPQPEPVSFSIVPNIEPLSLALKRKLEHVDGVCWLPIFKKAVIVIGYPILRRPQSKFGLEASLNVIAALMRTNFADRFNGKLFVKGYSSMLVSSETSNDLLLWHYYHGSPHKYMSYLDHDLSRHLDLELDRLPHFRHIIGWCEKANITIGSLKIDCPVKWSKLKPLPVVDSHFPGYGHLFAPVRISNGEPVVLSNQNQNANIVPEDYETIFRVSSNKFALLWDVEGQRGWLVNMLAALLHLIRNSLLIDQKLLDELFILKPEDLEEPEPGPFAAKKFLSNIHNLCAKVSVSKALPHRYEILESRMIRFYHMLNQAFDHQRNQKISSVTSNEILGWDFRGIASQKGSSMRSIRIPAEGKGWAELMKALGVVTLFGNGFGELISAPPDSTSHCEYWRTLPTNKYYVAISAYDLGEIAEAHECEVANDPEEFVPNLLWHSPQGQIDACGCENHGCTSSSLVQVLMPVKKRSATLAMSEQVDMDRFRIGAFVFGHNESVNWQWHDDYDVREFSEVAISETTCASKIGGQSKDSGYETMDTSNSVDALNTNFLQTTSELQHINTTNSNDTSGTAYSQRVYSSPYFEGGNSHLGDNHGDRYHNCSFNFYPSDPPQPHLPTIDSSLTVPNSSPHPSGQSLQYTDLEEDEYVDEFQSDERNCSEQSEPQQGSSCQQQSRKRRRRE